jgi:hypothetical protein
MNKIIIILNLLFICLSVAAQSKIMFCEDLTEQTDRFLQWTINGITFSPTSDEVTIYPHKKGMDTIFFQETRNFKTKFDTVFCRIPNGQELTMKIGCCDDGFDIVRKEEYEKRKQLYLAEPSLDFDSLDMTLLEFGTLKFLILNKPISDTLICIYAGEFTVGQMITIDKNYGWVKPCRIGYIDNIINVYVIKTDKNVEYEMIKDEYKDENECNEGIDIVWWNKKDWEKDWVILKQFGLRLFNNEKVIIQYDYLTGKTELVMW